MGTKEIQIAVALGWPIIEWLLRTDTNKLKEKMAKADTDGAKRDVIVDAVIDELGDTVIKDIIKADNTEEVVEVVTQPGVVNGILAAIGGLFGLIFKKRKD